MNHCSKLFEISDEFSNLSSQKQIQIASEFISSLNDSGELKIYSIIKKSIIHQETNISTFTCLSSSSISSPIIAALSGNTIKLITFIDQLEEAIPFDTSNRLTAFSINKLNDNCSTLCEFSLQFSFKSFVPSDINSLIILDDQDTLHQFLMFPDGLYNIKTESAKGCTSFAFSGLYLAGQSPGNIHFWTSNLKYICSSPASGASLCTISSDRFAVINNEEKNADLLIVSANSNAKNEKIELKEIESTDFITLYPDGSVVGKPQDSIAISQSHYVPLFVKGKEIYTFDHDIYIQRIAAAFPIAVSIPILTSRAKRDESGVQFVSETILKIQNPHLFESYLNSNEASDSITFLNKFISIVKMNSNKDGLQFTQSLSNIIHSYCIQKIQNAEDQTSEGFSTVLINYRNLFYPLKPIESSSIPPYKTTSTTSAPQQIKEEKLLEFALDSLEKRQITNSLPSLKLSFPTYSPFQLFRTLIIQQSWCKVCIGKIDEEARPLLLKLGEDPIEHFYLMWKSTTRNGTRQLLYEYLCRKEKILPKSDDERHHKILKSITDKYPNTSFHRAQQQLSSSSSSVLRPAQNDDSKLPPWQPIVDINKDFNENKSMIFADLFKIEDEKPPDSSSYFVGNILLIEAQEGKGSLNWLENKEDPIDRLWIIHCEHKINDLVISFENELKKSTRSLERDKFDCIKFVDKYYDQMNTYELETLLDLLCKYGHFAQKELDNFELLLVRICKNQCLFNEAWWNNQAKIDFGWFFKQFAQFCAKKSLFMPFEMFVLSHPKARNEDISEVKEPLINFIWDLWVKRDPSAATLSCMQFIAKSNSTNPVELWDHLPSDSLAPLASYVWNKDPQKFKPESEETRVLSERLKNDYPLLSSLVKGEIPHPQGSLKEPPPSKWRSPIYTSKYDLELHDLIQSHFANYDFDKVFTDYYGRNNPGEANFPHFDHPELITKPSEPPYVHYVKLMLPVSAFQQAVEDGVKEEQFKDICVQCLKEGLYDKQIRLAVLSFIELVDIKFKWDYAMDYKLCIALYDILVKGVNGRDKIVGMLISVYLDKNQDVAKELKRLLEPTSEEPELFLLSILLGIRCGLPLDYTPINVFASSGKTAELLLFIDRAAELGAHYPISEIEKIVTEKMPRENPLRAHLLFHLKQSLPSEEGSIVTDIPALVVYRAVKRTDQRQDISLLQEALNRKVQLYALLATSIKGADLMLCALVTMLTMVEGQSTFDVTNPPPHDQMVTLFMQTLSQLLSENKSLELMQTLELFSENSIVVNLVHFYRSIELFAFRRTESVLPDLNSKLKSENDQINDDLLGEVPVKNIIDIFFPMLDKLVKICAERSQIHVFRFLQVLDGSIVSPFLAPRVSLCKVIAGFDNFRRAIVHCDLLGSPDKIVSDLVLNHSLALGQAAAECLGISADAATKQWLTFQYSNAATPAQVLEIHEEIVPSIQNADPLFFIYLFASLLPFEQPINLIPIINYAQSIMQGEEYSTALKFLNALLLHLNICKENKIEVQQSPGGLPSLNDVLKILFPGQENLFKDAPQHIPLSIASPVLYGLDTLQRFFESSVDKAIDICLDKREADNAHLICEWRNRDPHNIQLLEAVQSVISDEELSPENKELIEKFGNPKEDMEGLLQSIAKSNGWRFVLIFLHYKAAKLLNLPTTNLLHRKTSEFVESKLAVDTNNWALIRDLISTSKMSSSEVASCLGQAYANHIKETLAKGNSYELPKTQLSPNDYDENFIQFTKLCESPTAVGEKLFDIARKGSKVQLQSTNPPVAQQRPQQNQQQRPQQQRPQQQNQQQRPQQQNQQRPQQQQQRSPQQNQQNQNRQQQQQQDQQDQEQQPQKEHNKFKFRLPTALNPLLNKKEDKDKDKDDSTPSQNQTPSSPNQNPNQQQQQQGQNQNQQGQGPNQQQQQGQKRPVRPRPKPRPRAEVDPALLLPDNVVVNLLLHASLCTADIDEIAELLDNLLGELTNDNDNRLIIDIVSIFPDPALIPRFFQYLIAQEKLDELPHQNLNEKVGRVIMNCARHHHPFDPSKYLDLTLKYNLFRDHAELQMECGNRVLDEDPDTNKLRVASRNFLLALAYFLHEKCYSLSMECLKKLSLISLQIEMSEPPILKLDKAQVQQFMNTKDFPFALTVAVAYDMDNEANWAEAIYNQSVLKQGEDFLTAFQYFRPITSTLCDGVVRKYKAANLDEGQTDRMKSFLTNIPNLVERYRIAKSLEFKDKIDEMKAHNPVVCEWCERVLMSKQ